MAVVPPPVQEREFKQTADPRHMKTGEEFNLSQAAPGLSRVMVGLGWDAPEKQDGFDVDVDASVFMLRHDTRVRYDTDFVFYNNLETENGAVKHNGDNTTGDGDGDDETIDITLENVPFDIDRLVFIVSIHNATERHQTFGIIKNAFMRIVNKDTNEEIIHYDLTEDASEHNAIIFGELFRDGMGWRFRSMGAGSAGGLYKIAKDYGVNVAPN